MATRLRDIVRASKTSIKVGTWKVGKVPRADFPTAKKAYNLGASVEWSVIAFAALGLDCRVLVMYHSAKERFQAVLGAMRGDQLSIQCTYEYHATEPGWHCHAVCEDARSAPVGWMRGPWVKRIPSARAVHMHLDFGIVDKQGAQRFALDCYKIRERGSLI